MYAGVEALSSVTPGAPEPMMALYAVPGTVLGTHGETAGVQFQTEASVQFPRSSL